MTRTEEVNHVLSKKLEILYIVSNLNISRLNYNDKDAINCLKI